MKQAISRIINKDIKQIEELKKLDIHVNFNEDDILKNKNIIISGGMGFIGKYILQILINLKNQNNTHYRL